MIKESVTGLKYACILDLSANKTLTTKDAKKINYLVFGGILGDYPRKKRTKALSPFFRIKRNLGKKQFSTDTAVYVAKLICSGKKLNDLRFKDNIEIRIKEGESVIIPFCYVVEKNKIFMSNEFVNHIRKRKEF